MAILCKLQEKSYCCNRIYFCGQIQNESLYLYQRSNPENVGVSLDDCVLIKKTNPKSIEKTALLCSTT